MRCTRGSKLILSLYPSLEKEDQEGPFPSRVLLARSGEDTREKKSSLDRCCFLVRRKGREGEFQTCLPRPQMIKFPAAHWKSKVQILIFLKKMISLTCLTILYFLFKYIFGESHQVKQYIERSQEVPLLVCTHLTGDERRPPQEVATYSKVDCVFSSMPCMWTTVFPPLFFFFSEAQKNLLLLDRKERTSLPPS